MAFPGAEKSQQGALHPCHPLRILLQGQPGGVSEEPAAPAHLLSPPHPNPRLWALGWADLPLGQGGLPLPQQLAYPGPLIQRPPTSPAPPPLALSSCPVILFLLLVCPLSSQTPAILAAVCALFQVPGNRETRT